VSRRKQIEMSEEEVLAFLDEQRVVTCATHGPRGWPHLMPLWYLVRDGEVWAWTYGKSQKVLNLERDPRATLQVEAGEQYQELRGVMFECDTEIIRETERVQEFGEQLFERYTGGSAADVRDMVAAQAPKRVVMHFAERRRASWDHRKLGGVY
jgi:PPOX class probable F420-dependent enzyme